VTIFSIYKEYCQHKNSEIRLNFIYNLPAVLGIFGYKYFDHIKKSYLNILLNDTSQNVKIYCISGISQIIKMIGISESHKIFAESIIEFITNTENNEDYEILKRILKVLPDILESLFNKKHYEENENQRQFYEDIFEILLDLNKTLEITTKWRLQFSLHQIFSNTK